MFISTWRDIGNAAEYRLNRLKPLYRLSRQPAECGLREWDSRCLILRVGQRLGRSSVRALPESAFFHQSSRGGIFFCSGKVGVVKEDAPLGEFGLRVSEREGSDVSLLSWWADVSKRRICLEIQPKMSGLSGCWPQLYPTNHEAVQRMINPNFLIRFPSRGSFHGKNASPTLCILAGTVAGTGFIQAARLITASLSRRRWDLSVS